jgi:hypothetical protein
MIKVHYQESRGDSWISDADDIVESIDFQIGAGVEIRYRGGENLFIPISRIWYISDKNDLDTTALT